MWYWIIFFIVGLWVAFDAKKRGNEYINWAAGTVIAAPLVLPVYLARRKLLGGERRDGGTAWNVLKNFALTWTITIFVYGIVSLFKARDVYQHASSSAEQAGATVGAGISIVLLAVAWLIPMVISLILGAFLKKAEVETGEGTVVKAEKKKMAENFQVKN